MNYKCNLKRSYCVPVKDYSLEKTIECGQFFRWRKLPDGGYLIFSRDTYCEVRQDGDTLHLETFGEYTERYWPFMLATDVKTPDLKEHMQSHALLREAYDFSKGLRILRQDPWEALATFTLSQRNNIPRIKQNVEAVCWAAGRMLGYEYYGFPRAESIKPSVLHGCNLGYRESYLYGIAHAVQSHAIDLKALVACKTTSERAMQELTRLPGVGPKVAQCVMLFGLMHGDVFPVDVWIERAIKEANITREEIASYGQYAGLVQQHLYYYMLNRR